MNDKSRYRTVTPTMGDALENPICPNHHRRMGARVCRALDSGLTWLWWWCPVGGCVTAMVPLPPGAVENLGPAIPEAVKRIGPAR